MYEHRNDEIKEMAKCARSMKQQKVWKAMPEEYRSLDNNAWLCFDIQITNRIFVAL